MKTQLMINGKKIFGIKKGVKHGKQARRDYP
jgi:hypothetical protein